MAKVNILVIGGGGREHALVWKLAQSEQCDILYCAPGNAGTASLATNVPIDGESMDELVAFAKEKNIGLTVVGPEAPLAAGIVDTFQAAGLTIFGPTKAAAQLEASKAFMKGVLTEAGVPTARYEVFTDRDAAVAALDHFDATVVVKADGLAAGKGVVVATSRQEALEAIDSMMIDAVFGAAGGRVILEETLPGEEASILAFCDGKTVSLMPTSQDHKRVGDGDTGPNTGGMGAYSPAPVVTEEMQEWVRVNVMQKTIDTLAAMGSPYTGILYAGLMIGPEGAKILEFNCRFGDPECQPILMRLKSDLVEILLACAEGRLAAVDPEWSDTTTVCVVMAAGGYPRSYDTGALIRGIDAANALDNLFVFHAGTAEREGTVATSGGRVLGVTASGPGIREAITRAYEGVAKIAWQGEFHRSDIGKRALDRRP